jgi:hypothetical protein
MRWRTCKHMGVQGNRRLCLNKAIAEGTYTHESNTNHSPHKLQTASLNNSCSGGPGRRDAATQRCDKGREGTVGG